MTTIFSDAEIVKVMDTYEDLVAEFGGNDGLALSVACKEVEVENENCEDSDLDEEEKQYLLHLCEDCEDSDLDEEEKQNDIEQIGGWAYNRLKCKGYDYWYSTGNDFRYGIECNNLLVNGEKMCKDCRDNREVVIADSMGEE